MSLNNNQKNNKIAYNNAKIPTKANNFNKILDLEQFKQFDTEKIDSE